MEIDTDNEMVKGARAADDVKQSCLICILVLVHFMFISIIRNNVDITQKKKEKLIRLGVRWNISKIICNLALIKLRYESNGEK